MRCTRLTQLLTVALTASSVALCQIAPVGAASGMVLRYIFRAGPLHTYTVSIQVAEVVQVGVAQKTAFADQFTLVQRVTQTYADGSALLQDSFGSSSITANKLKVPIVLSRVVTTQHVARDGSVLTSKTVGASTQNGLAFLVGNIGSRPLLPKSAVSVGSTWTSQQRFSLGQIGVFSATQRLKLTGVTTKGGDRLAQIQVSGQQPVHGKLGTGLETGTATSKGTLQFDITAGMLAALHETIEQHVTVTNATGKVSSTSPTITFTATVDIVKVS